MENTIVNKELVNFKIPVELKRNFISLCRLKGSNMTVTVVEFMKKFVIEEGNNIKNDIKNMKEIESMVNGIKDNNNRRKDDIQRSKWFSNSY